MREQPAVLQRAVRRPRRSSPSAPTGSARRSRAGADSRRSAGAADPSGCRPSSRSYGSKPHCATCTPMIESGAMPSSLHAFEIGRHVGLADQHIAHADLLEVIAQRRLADAQRPAVPVRAVRAHVAAGVEAHARGAADRRLHVGAREAHAARRQRVDVRRLQRRMPGAAEIVVAQLVAHDEEDIFVRGMVRFAITPPPRPRPR